MRTIFFDFGNVIAFFDHRRAADRLARFTPRSADELLAVIYGGPEEDAYERGELTTAEFTAFALRAGELTCSAAEFLDAFGDIFTRNAAVCDLLPRLGSEHQLVLASNTNDAHFTRYRREFAAELAHFAHLGTSHHAGARKPDAGFFAYLQSLTAAAAGDCVFIDDMPVNVAAAERHGFRGVLYRPGDDLPAKLAAAGLRVPPPNR